MKPKGQFTAKLCPTFMICSCRAFPTTSTSHWFRSSSFGKKYSSPFTMLSHPAITTWHLGSFKSVKTLLVWSSFGCSLLKFLVPQNDFIHRHSQAHELSWIFCSHSPGVDMITCPHPLAESRSCARYCIDAWPLPTSIAPVFLSDPASSSDCTKNGDPSQLKW